METDIGRRSHTTVKGRTKSAKKIPPWLWLIIAKSLGIKLHPNDKPIVSSILHILTFGSAAGLFVTNCWYCGFNIVSIRTSSDILDGTVAILTMTCFCGLGVYSHRLAYRLFVHPKFLDMFRLHSKTVMKINSAIVIFIILSSFIAVLNISTAQYLLPVNVNQTLTAAQQQADVPSNVTDNVNPCQLVDLDVVICQVYWLSQMVFSIFFLVWNLLVAVVLVSVARTQTISIRRLLRELEYDSFLLDKKILQSYGSSKTDEIKEYVWMDNDNIADAFNEPVDNSTAATEHDVQPNQESGDELTRRSSTNSFQDLQLRISTDERGPDTSTSTFRRLAEDSKDDDEDDKIEPHIMSEEEIMNKYWKLNMSVRLASIALQRWMSSIVGMISAWSAIRMVYWLSHTPTLYGVFMFILPLLLLPLLASSYAEVNYEGIKVIQCILPTKSRIHMFQYLYGIPIRMTVYGHAISYGTIGTVVAGILAAFASKILLQEMSNL